MLKCNSLVIMENMCRACLVTEGNMVPLDEDFVTSYNLLTDLSISLQDEMPQNLCINCAQLVRSFIDFRQKSILSENTLQGIIEDKKPNDENFEIKQEVKNEYESNLFDDYFDNEYLGKEGSQLPNKIKKEKPVKKKKHNKATKKQNKTKKQKKANIHLDEDDLNHCTTISPISQTFSCGLCKKQFDERNDLDSHLEMHTKYTECEICHERFSTWPGLLGHRLEHLPDKRGHCHLCKNKWRYKAPLYLEHHYITVHNKGKQMSLKCKICQHPYKTPRMLREHLNITHGEKKYFCDYCSKGFPKKYILKAHIKIHGEPKCICDLCGFRCHLRQNLQAHKIRKHSPNSVLCKQCTNRFESQEKLDKHKCGVKVKEIACHDCGKMVVSKLMSRHMLSHGEARYKCARCPSAFRTSEALRVHTDRHDNVRRLQCEFCPAKFFSSTVLLKHRRIHTGEKPYVCSICGKGFTGGNNLKVHMKVHGICAVVKRDSNVDNMNDIFNNSKQFYN